jgi:hypothetical protein
VGNGPLLTLRAVTFPEDPAMDDLWVPLMLVAFWFLLMRVVLPRFGVPT